MNTMSFTQSHQLSTLCPFALSLTGTYTDIFPPQPFDSNLHTHFTPKYTLQLLRIKTFLNDHNYSPYQMSGPRLCALPERHSVPRH